MLSNKALGASEEKALVYQEYPNFPVYVYHCTSLAKYSDKVTYQITVIELG
jgi:hypothetical protein